MKSIQEFRMDLLEKFQNGCVYNFVDSNEFSVVDLAINGDDGEASAFRLVITKLPKIFEDDEKVIEKVSKYY